MGSDAALLETGQYPKTHTQGPGHVTKLERCNCQVKERHVLSAVLSAVIRRSKEVKEVLGSSKAAVSPWHLFSADRVEIGPHTITQAGLELAAILLPQSPQC